jgi:hypothetical protein
VNLPAFRAQALRGLTGLVSDEVGERLAELAYDVPRTNAIIELGAFKGKSTAYIAEGARLGGNAHVWTVDPWDLPGNIDGKHHFAQHVTREAFRVQVHSMGLDEFITPIQDFSLRAADRWEGPEVGLLYIDGSHTYTDVRADYEAWEKHLAPRATVVFDDYRTKKNPGVTQYVDELRRDFDFDISTPPLAIRCLRG